MNGDDSSFFPADLQVRGGCRSGSDETVFAVVSHLSFRATKPSGAISPPPLAVTPDGAERRSGVQSNGHRFRLASPHGVSTTLLTSMSLAKSACSA